jgi:hypothetical protein
MGYLNGYTAETAFDKGWDLNKAIVKHYIDRGMSEDQALDLLNIHHPKCPAVWFLIPIVMYDVKPYLMGDELYDTIVNLLDKKFIPYPYGKRKIFYGSCITPIDRNKEY